MSDAAEATVRRPLVTEVEEYSSLVRALKTEHTLDLAAHLLEHFHEETKPTAQLHNRDQWTRWPLPDAPLADWDLEDEIRAIVRHWLLEKRDLEKNLDLDDAEEDYVEDLVDHLMPILLNFLERILTLVHAHVFPRPPCLQDRINPLNWRDLANILASPAAEDLVDAQMLKSYVDRMEALLGSENRELQEPCPRRAIDRRDMLDQRRTRRQDLYNCLMFSLFSR
ncbi:hypothetical protein P691DRAFT_268621 [Macrolepiota fuliginosa MF-IS2]|uniref:Uncharacterized protein n=1 Tax=Macrolepiota fuliginosa MF-IS2 TaxID=1400762 RepID=A0A9P6C8G2_9AGAR|nr:hypothetical protein P691DRAFT_268621 [Macrolepiota fuliginosa MF-IS2]